MSLYYFKKQPNDVENPTNHPPSVVEHSTHYCRISDDSSSTCPRKVNKRSSHNRQYSVATCRQKTYAKYVENSTLIKEIRSYNNFHHCNSTDSYFTSDVIGFWVQILLCWCLKCQYEILLIYSSFLHNLLPTSTS